MSLGSGGLGGGVLKGQERFERGPRGGLSEGRWEDKILGLLVLDATRPEAEANFGEQLHSLESLHYQQRSTGFRPSWVCSCLYLRRRGFV